MPSLQTLAVTLWLIQPPILDLLEANIHSSKKASLTETIDDFEPRIKIIDNGSSNFVH
jgi:hypothetical protein